jgi:hypothetical protein
MCGDVAEMCGDVWRCVERCVEMCGECPGRYARDPMVRFAECWLVPRSGPGSSRHVQAAPGASRQHIQASPGITSRQPALLHVQAASIALHRAKCICKVHIRGGTWGCVHLCLQPRACGDLSVRSVRERALLCRCHSVRERALLDAARPLLEGEANALRALRLFAAP